MPRSTLKAAILSLPLIILQPSYVEIEPDSSAEQDELRESVVNDIREETGSSIVAPDQVEPVRDIELEKTFEDINKGYW